MGRSSAIVTRISRSRAQLPGWSGVYARLVQYFRERGVLDWLENEFCIPRGSGYQPVDAFLVGLAYAAARATEGMQKFLTGLGAKGRCELAALGGRKRFPTQSSFSRLLASIGSEGVQAFSDMILALGHDEVVACFGESTSCKDAHGRPFRAYHCDQRVQAFRQRALPEAEDLPPPRRLGPNTAQTGYAGRKRGEVVQSRSLTMDAGTGMAVHLVVQSGPMDVSTAVGMACAAVEASCSRLGVAKEDTLLIHDGAGNGLEQVRASERWKQPLLVRLSLYSAIRQSDAFKSITEWKPVVDSLSGPKREAADLEYIRYPDDILMHTLISRFTCSSGVKSGAGFVDDGWQYEVFGSTFDSTRLRTEDYESLYYGRCGQENRFNQQDHEGAKAHLFSENSAGQQFLLTTGLAVWNCKTVLGLRLAQHPADPIGSLQLEESGYCKADGIPPLPRAEPNPSIHTPSLPLPSRLPSRSPEPSPRRVASTQDINSDPRTDSDMPCATRQWPHVVAGDARLPLTHRMDPQFLLSPCGGHIVCPKGQKLFLQTPRAWSEGHVQLRFRAGRHTCGRCSASESCFHSKNDRPRKELRYIVTEDLVLVGEGRKPRKKKDPRPRLPPSPVALPPPVLLRPPPNAAELQFPTLVPSLLRNYAFSLLSMLMTHVFFRLPPEPSPTSPLLALTAAARQHRRKTWKQQHDWNALPEGTPVSIDHKLPHNWQSRLPGPVRKLIALGERHGHRASG